MSDGDNRVNDEFEALDGSLDMSVLSDINQTEVPHVWESIDELFPLQSENDPLSTSTEPEIMLASDEEELELFSVVRDGNSEGGLEHKSDYGIDDIDFAALRDVTMSLPASMQSTIPLKTGAILVTQLALTEHFSEMQALKSTIQKKINKPVFFQTVNESYLEQLSEQARKTSERIDSSEESQTTYKAKEEFEKLIQRGYSANATDIQMVLGETLVVNYRVDKIVQKPLRRSLPYEIGDRIINQAINTNKGGGDVNYDTPQSFRFRVKVTDPSGSTKLIQLRAEKVPLEIDGRDKALGLFIRLVKTDTPVRLEQLGVDKPLCEAFKRALNKPKGLILVTGPTSSGKTTLLGGAMHYFPKHLTGRTVEDPVELNLHAINENITQSSQDREQWDEFVASMLRQDPNLILLGEVRSLKQAETLLTAANTGHISVSTLHTNDAVGIITRLLDMGIKLEDLCINKLLQLLVATRLVAKTCPQCSLHFDEISEEDQRRVERVFGTSRLKHMRFVNEERKPCRNNKKPLECGCNAGVRGMVGVSEFLEPSSAMIDYIRTNRTYGLEAWLKERGWKTMVDIGRFKVEQGLIDPFIAAVEIEGLLEVETSDPRFDDNYGDSYEHQGE